MPGRDKSGKCWAVTSGAYGGYSVWCVFERKEDAEEYAARQMKLPVEEYRRRAELPSNDKGSFHYMHGLWVEEYQFWKADEVPSA